MKITKARLTEIVKGVIAEEAYDCRRGLHEYTGEPISSKEAPELIKTWEKEIMGWLQQQFNPQYPLEESQEIPMIVTALDNVRTKLADISSKQEFRQ